MFKNHKKKAKHSKDDDKKDIDFIEIGNNVFLDKKNNKTYEIADDDDLNEDLL
jgi:hypothetical protein